MPIHAVNVVAPPVVQETEMPLESYKGAGPILVVDESPEILSLIETVLREDGFAVQTATSNEQALTKVALAMPSLVLLDAGLTPTTDDVFVAALREMYGSRVPLIVTSAVTEPACQRAIGRMGAVDAIRKPFDLGDLLVGVQRAVNAFRRSGSLTSAVSMN